MHPIIRFFQRYRILLLSLYVVAMALTFRKEIWQSLGLAALAFGLLFILPLAYLVFRRLASTRSRRD
jgi:hypothetical protein